MCPKPWSTWQCPLLFIVHLFFLIAMYILLYILVTKSQCHLWDRSISYTLKRCISFFKFRARPNNTFYIMEFQVRDFILRLKWTLSFIFNCKLIRESVTSFGIYFNFSYFYFISFFCIFISQSKLIKLKYKGPKKSDYFVLGIKKTHFYF